MKISMLTLAAVLSMHAGMQTASAQYQDDRKADSKAMQDDPAEMMQQYAQMSEPGYEHKLLEPFIGTWDVKATMWMDPDAPAIESKGKATTEWIMDGRYQRMTYEGEFMGARFNGESIGGYNKVTGKYFGTWIDSMNTGMSMSTGDVDASGKTFTYTGEYDDPMTGGKVKSREVIKVTGPNSYTMTGYTVKDDGSEFKHMVLEYTRAK